MNKKQIDRLLRLVDFLRELPDENLDMSDWNKSGIVKKKPGCGTRACIGGWSTLFFPELSLCELEWIDGKGIRLNGNSAVTGIDAIEKAWGVSYEDAERICMSEDIDSRFEPKEAANLLASIVQSNAAESGYDIVDEE